MKITDKSGALIARTDDIAEGDGTLLDNIAVFAHSGTEHPKQHGTQNIPMMVAGSAGGRINTGLHIRGGASPTSRGGASPACRETRSQGNAVP